MSIPNMASSNTTPPTHFDDFGLDDAQRASTMRLPPNPSASQFVKYKGRSRLDGAVHKVKKTCKSVFNSVRTFCGGNKKKANSDVAKPDMRAEDSSEPNANLATLDALNGAPLPAAPTTPPPDWVMDELHTPTKRNQIYSVHEVHAATPPPETRPSVLFTVPKVTGVEVPSPLPETASVVSTDAPTVSINTSVLGSERPSTATSSLSSTSKLPEFPIKKKYRESRAKSSADDTDEARKEWLNTLDNYHPEKDRRKSNIRASTTYPPKRPQQHLQKDASVPPRVATPGPFNPRISGFDCNKPYYPGKYSGLLPDAGEASDGVVPDVDTHEQAALDTLASNEAGSNDPVPVSTDSASVTDEPSMSKGKQPLYVGKYCPATGRNHVDLTQSGTFGRPYSLFGTADTSSNSASPYRFRGIALPSSPTLTTSTRGPRFTPSGDAHRKHYSLTEEFATFAAANSSEFLETVYENPPTPPPQEPLKVPVPPRKPVPKSSVGVAAAEPSKPAANLAKPLPPSPAPGSPRNLTPAAPTFPPRDDSLRNPVADNPTLRPRVPTPTLMNANGYPIHDHRRSAAFSEQPAYKPRGPMNEMETEEREKKVKRAESKRKADEEARQRNEKRMRKKLEVDKKAVRKMCGY